jgi:transcriptional regulator GlxA family with amidase domain
VRRLDQRFRLLPIDARQADVEARAQFVLADRLFEGKGTSYSLFVRSARLARARRMLTERRYSHLTVTEIAFAVGFGDLLLQSHLPRPRRCDAVGGAQGEHPGLTTRTSN